MEFKNDKPIYRQITDYAFGCILSGSWAPGCRVPSVRELAVEMGVNTHTVLKAYEELEARGIIAPRRGMGFFLADDARGRVDAERREEFFSDVLDNVFDTMDQLGITIDQLVEHYRQMHGK